MTSSYWERDSSRIVSVMEISVDVDVDVDVEASDVGVDIFIVVNNDLG